MNHFEVWPVAAAVLIEAGRELHYDTITKRVIATGLTTLGFKGQTPSQTIGALMRDHDKIFSSPNRGYYTVRHPEEVKRLPDVARVLGAMKESPTKAESPSEIEELKSRIKVLEARIALLQEKITYIAKICDSVRGGTE